MGKKKNNYHNKKNTNGKKNGGKGKQQHKGHNKGKQKQALYTVEVTNLEQNYNMDSVMNFLKKAASGTVYVTGKFKGKGKKPKCIFKFQSSEEARRFLDLDGINYYGKSLSIVENIPDISSMFLPDDQKSQLFGMIGNRFDASSQYLNLEGIAQECNMSFDNGAFVNTMWTIVRQNCPMVTSINFGSNEIESLTFFSCLSDMLPNVANLALQNNKIGDFAQVKYLSGFEGTLQHLVLSGNPIQVNNDPTLYRMKVDNVIMGLKQLDGGPTSALIEFDVDLFRNQLPNVLGSFMDASVGDFVKLFVQKYFEAYDSSRESLLAVYSDVCSFSLNLGQTTTQFDNRYAYRGKERNILKQNEDSSLQFLHRGKIDVMNTLVQLPRTQHDIANFVVDVVLVPLADASLLHTSVHGQFMEEVIRKQGNPLTITRNFHRSFMIVPARDSPIGGLVVNDAWHLYESEPHMKPVIVSTSSAAQVSTVTAPNEALVVQLSQATGVTQDVALQFLQAHNGDPQAAFNAIQQRK